jgi:hypothetical protein
MAAIGETDLFASNHYRPLSSGLGLPVANELYRHVVNLFCDRHIDVHRAEIMAELISRVAQPARTCGLALSLLGR